jgi:hypothetical protein
MRTRRVDAVHNPFAAFKAALEEQAWEQVRPAPPCSRAAAHRQGRKPVLSAGGAGARELPRAGACNLREGRGVSD